MTAIVALDLGTTGVRALVVTDAGKVAARAYRPLTTAYPHAGWVEQDPAEMWERSVEVMRESLQASGVAASDVSAIGVVTQRATVLAWDGDTGAPLAPAIGWQDAQTEHIYTQSGLYRVGLTLFDDDGGENTIEALDDILIVSTDKASGRFAFADSQVNVPLGSFDILPGMFPNVPEVSGDSAFSGPVQFSSMSGYEKSTEAFPKGNLKFDFKYKIDDKEISVKFEQDTEQQEWFVRLRAEGYRCEVCFGADDAIETLLDYWQM